MDLSSDSNSCLLRTLLIGTQVTSRLTFTPYEYVLTNLAVILVSFCFIICVCAIGLVKKGFLLFWLFERPLFGGQIFISPRGYFPASKEGYLLVNFRTGRGNLPSDMYLRWRCVSESAPHFVVMWVVSLQVLFYKWLNNRVIRNS